MIVIKITKQLKDIKVDNLSGTMKYIAYQKYIAIKWILEQHHYNIDRVKAWALTNRFTTKKELSRFIKPYEQVKITLDSNITNNDVKEYKQYNEKD